MNNPAASRITTSLAAASSTKLQHTVPATHQVHLISAALPGAAAVSEEERAQRGTITQHLCQLRPD